MYAYLEGRSWLTPCKILRGDIERVLMNVSRVDIIPSSCISISAVDLLAVNPPGNTFAPDRCELTCPVVL